MTELILYMAHLFNQFLVLVMLLLLIQDELSFAASITKSPECREKCGNFTIPYPFGVGRDCSREGFEITCNETFTPPKPFLGSNSSESNIVFSDITLSRGQARVYKYIGGICYNSSSITFDQPSDINFGISPFKFSDTGNKFTAVGCDTLAYISSNDQTGYASGCLATCNDPSSVTSGSCSGIGCCQTSIPKGLNYYNATFASSFNHSNVYQFNPCSWAFLVDKDAYQFDESDIFGFNVFDKYKDGVPLVLDWVVGYLPCNQSMQNKTSYACVSENSQCVDSSNGPGYTCNCSTGYQGNPYITGGCQDINECEQPDVYPCYGNCRNSDGNYSCSCPSGKHGDPYKGSCQDKFSLLLKLVTGISGGIIIACLISLGILLVRNEKKLKEAKDNFFKQNGGAILFDKMRAERGVSFKVFKEEELDKATNKFDNKLELGRGGHGTVFQGFLNGVGKVAVKKAKTIDESQKEEFVKELVILSQINHRNVVKLLGCCLEVEVPMLVYEYIPNGTLSYHIHDMNNIHPVPLDTRLRIAFESAEALAYLHSSASPPIIHGDVKSTNILLDENYVAKVADFGASMLVAMDDEQLAELVQGTQGYLDPEYLQTRKLTEKSDVYSFGVVLLELLTGKKAIYVSEQSGSKELKSLALSFLSAVKENRIMEILDSRVRMEGVVELIQEFVGLIQRCLSVNGEDRPTMKEVAEELQTIRKSKRVNVSWAMHVNNPEETESLLGAESSQFSVTVERSAIYSMEKNIIEAGR